MAPSYTYEPPPCFGISNGCVHIDFCRVLNDSRIQLCQSEQMAVYCYFGVWCVLKAGARLGRYARSPNSIKIFEYILFFSATFFLFILSLFLSTCRQRFRIDELTKNKWSCFILRQMFSMFFCFIIWTMKRGFEQRNLHSLKHSFSFSPLANDRFLCNEKVSLLFLFLFVSVALTNLSCFHSPSIVSITSPKELFW